MVPCCWLSHQRAPSKQTQLQSGPSGLEPPLKTALIRIPQLHLPCPLCEISAFFIGQQNKNFKNQKKKNIYIMIRNEKKRRITFFHDEFICSFILPLGYNFFVSSFIYQLLRIVAYLWIDIWRVTVQVKRNCTSWHNWWANIKCNSIYFKNQNFSQPRSFEVYYKIQRNRFINW